MWHEARKQERMIRGMIVDYRRRAERRKDFYEKIKAEPTQFLQIHGRPCKVHLDPAIAAAGEGPAIMMPWQGDTNNMIDRFDVRAHLDYIPELRIPELLPEELSPEERQCNYERYRILAQNVFLGISEDKFLQQLAIEEQFGVTIEEKEHQKEKLHEKKGTGAAIGYNYSDPGAQPSGSNGPETKKVEPKDSDDESDLEIIDVDLSIDVNKMEASQAHELNGVGPQFGMAGCDLFSFLTGDADDAEHQKQLLREEKEKAMFSGRKSRRERRAHRDKKLATRVVSPPSYAAPSSMPARSPTRSPSRSPSPETGENIQFITSFGGEEEEKQPTAAKPLYADKVKQNLKMLYADVARKPRKRPSPPSSRRTRQIGPRGPNSRSRSFSRSRSRSRSRSKSHSRSRSWRKSRSKSRSSRSRSVSSRSRSRSYSPYRRTRSRSRSRNRRNRYSRSPANHGSGYAKRNNSRSMSFESNDKNASKPAVPRYYGRRKEDKSSSELSVDSDSSISDDDAKKMAVGNKSNTNQNQLRLSGSSSKGASRETLSLKEKLKRKMQAQLSRQLRADKRAEAERQERESRRQARRDEEMRELAIKLRRKQREMRHQQNRRSSEDDSDRSHSRSSSRESLSTEKKREDKSKSRSATPPPPRIPVWELNRESTSTSTSTSTSQQRPRTSEHGETSHYSERRRYQEPEPKEDRRHDDERPPHYSNRYDKYPSREQGPPPRHDSYNRYENQGHDGRWKEEGYPPGRRRPYGHRGGYRGHGYRHTEHSSSPSQEYDKEAADQYARSKVKLVDY